EFKSLEELTRTTLSTRNMGWLRDEKEKAFDHAYRILLDDKAEGKNAEGSYAEQFKNVYAIDLKAIGRDAAIEWIARSMSDYMRSLRTARTSPYDEFVKLNHLEDAPVAEEDPKLYASRHLRRIAAREAAGTLRLPKDFDKAALAGLKIFFMTDGEARAGNCVSCHTPPFFTDFSFHNVGISQRDFDAIHGEGSFMEEEIPNAVTATRPDDELRGTPSGREPEKKDLGYWNFAELKTSPLRRRGESDDEFLTRMIGAFKTPTLRNLKFSEPYMHNGAFQKLEDALREIVASSALARAGKLRSGDPEMKNVRFAEADIPPLVAFLDALNEHYE
ncbi:hypothetical protein HY256_05380, partial [Candidatus Sumerlaeota bacterium]|nr:hypothetical protein [Candidatus Sumerlaeota bacterium]